MHGPVMGSIQSRETRVFALGGSASSLFPASPLPRIGEAPACPTNLLSPGHRPLLPPEPAPKLPPVNALRALSLPQPAAGSLLPPHHPFSSPPTKMNRNANRPPTHATISHLSPLTIQYRGGRGCCRQELYVLGPKKAEPTVVVQIVIRNKKEKEKNE